MDDDEDQPRSDARPEDADLDVDLQALYWSRSDDGRRYAVLGLFLSLLGAAAIVLGSLGEYSSDFIIGPIVVGVSGVSVSVAAYTKLSYSRRLEKSISRAKQRIDLAHETALILQANNAVQNVRMLSSHSLNGIASARFGLGMAPSVVAATQLEKLDRIFELAVETGDPSTIKLVGHARSIAFSMIFEEDDWP